MNLVHRVRVPHAAGPEPRPAVVLVHGWLGNEKVMSVFERLLPPGVVTLSPRAPVQMRPDSYGWFVGLDNDAGVADGLAQLRAFVEALPAAYPVDPARITLVGFSQGGAMSAALALSAPSLVRALGLLAGFVPAQAQAWATPGKLAGKPVFIAHGVADDTVPIDKARAAQVLLSGTGALVEYHEYPVGHKLNTAGMHDLQAWLAENAG
ncbi:MAG: alpha/beta fold hydrolase [Anaerolineales bacterium]|nr:alpha/beta fold hydrolase [Anaerolineales bacterium]